MEAVSVGVYGLLPMNKTCFFLYYFFCFTNEIWDAYCFNRANRVFLTNQPGSATFVFGHNERAGTVPGTP